MANRNFTDMQSIHREVKELYLKASADGAGSWTVLNGKGISSIAGNGVGITKIFLEDKYPQLFSVNDMIIDSTARNYDFQVKAHDVGSSSGLPYIEVFSLVAGVETEVPNGTQVMFKFVLKNTNVTI